MAKGGESANVKTGDYVITKRSTGSNWEGAQVTMVSPGVVTVKYVSDLEEANLPPEKVIAASPAAAADMKTDAAKTDFLKKAQAHAPQAPPGYKPKVGEHIFGGGTSTPWFAGRVNSVNGNQLLVEGRRPKPSQ